MIFKKVIDKLDKLNTSKPIVNALLAAMVLIAMFCLKTTLTLLTTQWYAPTIAGGFCLSGVLLLLMLRKKSVTVTKSGVFLLVMELLVGCSFILNGLMLRVVAYCIIGVVLAFLLPIAQFSLATNDTKKVADLFCVSLIVSYVILLIANMCIGPILVKFQFGSIMGNSNMLGYYLATLIPSITYIMLKKELPFFAKAILWGLLVSALSMLVFTSSRTSALAVFFSMGFFLLALLFSRDKKKKLKFNVKHVIIVVVILVSVPFILFFMLSYVRKSIVIAVHKSNLQNAASSSLSDSEIQEDQEIINELENVVTEYSFDYYIKGVDGSGEDSFTSGRIAIWKDFAKNVGIMGHASEHREIIENTRRYENAKAHNVYLQVAYNAGAGAGAAYLLMVVFIGIKAIMYFVKIVKGKAKRDMELLLSICYFIVFAVVSLTSDGYMVFSFFPPTLFWFMSYKFIFKDKQEKQEKTEEK